MHCSSHSLYRELDASSALDSQVWGPRGGMVSLLHDESLLIAETSQSSEGTTSRFVSPTLAVTVQHKRNLLSTLVSDDDGKATSTCLP